MEQRMAISQSIGDQSLTCTERIPGNCFSLCFLLSEASLFSFYLILSFPVLGVDWFLAGILSVSLVIEREAFFVICSSLPSAVTGAYMYVSPFFSNQVLRYKRDKGIRKAASEVSLVFVHMMTVVEEQ